MVKQHANIINEAELLAKMGLGLQPSSSTVAAPPIAPTPIPSPTTAAPLAEGEEQEGDEVDKHEVDSQQGQAEEAEPKLVKPKKTATNAPPPAIKYKKGSYEDLFLAKNVKGAHAKLTMARVSVDTYERLSLLVRAAHGNSISLVDYVNNVLLHHLHKYKDELQRCYTERQKEVEVVF